jgi:heparan-sulfate lyase
MPDGGSYIYSGDPENRAWFRQTRVHQTLTLNGENSRYAPKLLLWNPGKHDDMLVVENKSYDNLTHRRSIFFVDKRFFILVDEAIGNATGNIDLHFQFAPGEAVFNRNDLAVTSGFKEGWNILVQTQNQPGLQLDEEEGQVSFLYTRKEPRPAFRYRISKSEPGANVRFVTLVAPYEKNLPEIRCSVYGSAEIGSSGLMLSIEENGIKRKIGYSLK